jgi:hypothetical protein
MPRFLLLLAPAREAPPAETLSAGALGEQTRRFMDWVAAGMQGGVIRAGARLAERSALVSRGAGTLTVSERPPGPRAAQGYFVVEAESFGAAVALAATCPGADPGTIEVLQLDLAAAIGETVRE